MDVALTQGQRLVDVASAQGRRLMDVTLAQGQRLGPGVDRLLGASSRLLGASSRRQRTLIFIVAAVMSLALIVFLLEISIRNEPARNAGDVVIGTIPIPPPAAALADLQPVHPLAALMSAVPAAEPAPTPMESSAALRVPLPRPRPTPR